MTNCRLIDWILVMALALAPFQSAWSGFDTRCEHARGMQGAPAAKSDSGLETLATTDTSQHRTCNHLARKHGGSSSSSKDGDCCCHAQNNGDSNCAGSCQPVPAALYLPPLKLTLALEFFTVYETQLPVFNDGRTVPPPYQPPRG